MSEHEHDSQDSSDSPSLADRAGDAVKGLGDAVKGAGDSVRDAGSRAGDTVKDVGSRATQAVRDAGTQVATAAGHARDRLPDPAAIRRGLENPIGLIIAAAAVGFIAGMFLPVSDFERARLRPISDDLLERAGELRDELAEHGKAALSETASAAQVIVEHHAKEFASSLNVPAQS